MASEPQNMKALRRAKAVYLARAALRRKIKSGETTVADALRGEHPEIDTMTIGKLLESQHRWGPYRAETFLAPLYIRSSKRVKELTERQRELIAKEWD